MIDIQFVLIYGELEIKFGRSYAQSLAVPEVTGGLVPDSLQSNNKLTCALIMHHS